MVRVLLARGRGRVFLQVLERLSAALPSFGPPTSVPSPHRPSSSLTSFPPVAHPVSTPVELVWEVASLPVLHVVLLLLVSFLVVAVAVLWLWLHTPAMAGKHSLLSLSPLLSLSASLALLLSSLRLQWVWLAVAVVAPVVGSGCQRQGGGALWGEFHSPQSWPTL